MENAFDTVTAALTEAKRLNEVVDRQTTRLAYLLEGRLRHVHDSGTLRTLKRELERFDARTGRWKK